MNRPRILLIHLVANGDCLMATAVARQIKQDYPGCHLTWAISYKCRQAIDNNPDVDEVWEVRYGIDESPVGAVWHRVRREAETRRVRGDFDRIFATQIYPENIGRFDGTTRSSTFRCYPAPITVPVAPVFRLREEERARVARFARDHAFARYRHVILLECAPGSGQSTLNPAKGVQIASRIVETRQDTLVIVSSHLSFTPPHERILDGAALSFRENAALSHHCSFFVGCSSGITWLLTSDSAKPLPMVLFLCRRAMAGGFASVVHDFEYFHLPTDHLIENDATDCHEMAMVTLDALTDFRSAKARHHRRFKPNFWDFGCFFDYRSLRGALGIYRTSRLFIERNRFTWRDGFKLMPLLRVIGYACRLPFRHNPAADSTGSSNNRSRPR